MILRYRAHCVQHWRKQHCPNACDVLYVNLTCRRERGTRGYKGGSDVGLTSAVMRYSQSGTCEWARVVLTTDDTIVHNIEKLTQ